MRTLIVLILATMLFAVAPAGADEPPQDTAVRLEFDPDADDWVQRAPPTPGTPEGDLEIARQYYQNEDMSKARKAFSTWLKTYGKDHPLGRQARLGLGEALLAQREYYKSHLGLRALMLELGTDEVTVSAADLEFVIAEVFMSGTRRKWYGMRIAKADELGVAILDEIAASFPGTEMGERALRTKGDFYFGIGEFELAEDEFGRLLVDYPQSWYTRVATLRRAQGALARFPGTDFDDAPLVEAEERFLRFRDDFPQDAQANEVDLVLEDIRERRAQKEYEIAEYYVRVEQPRAGRFYFESVLRNWPGTLAATRAQTALSGTPAEPAAEHPPDTSETP